MWGDREVGGIGLLVIGGLDSYSGFKSVRYNSHLPPASYNKMQVTAKAIMTTQSLIDQNLRLLYQTDYLAWYEMTLAMVKSGQRNELDLDSLGEVLEDLVRDTKRSGRSYLKQIIIHLLMLQYWVNERDYNYRHWASEIANFRDELDTDMTTNLRNYLDSNLEPIYQKAVNYTVIKTGLDKNVFPEKCPYPLDKLLASDWLPEIE